MDFGGLRREFFTLLSDASSNALLQGSKKKFFTNNITEIQVKICMHMYVLYIIMNCSLQAQNFYYLGVYTAMSVVQGGCGLPVLAEAVYEYITSGKCTNIEVDISDLQDCAICEIARQASISNF